MPSWQRSVEQEKMADIVDSSITQVFRLPELLELILLQLPQRDILLSQRTSRDFRRTIEGSIRLQRALFFAPDWKLQGRASPYAASNDSGRKKPENNRILRRAFDGSYPTVTLVIENDSPTPNESAIGRPGSEKWSWDVCISFPAGDKTPPHAASVDYLEASWRRMYLSQPPPQTLHLVRRWQKSSNAAIEREQGITMGEFYASCRAQNAEKTAESWHQSYIGSDGDWHMEGNIRCSSIEESPQEAEESADIFSGYVFSKTVRDGSTRAFSNDWDPGRTATFARAMRR